MAGGSTRFRMPHMPLAIVAANARYGLASAPGSRHSTRAPLCSPTVRYPAVRLSRLHTIAVGAHDPSWYLLNEFTNGAYIHDISRAVAISPPRYQRYVSDMLCSASSDHIRLLPPSRLHTLECRWQLDPASAIVHFAMNVIATSFSAAISFAPCLYKA